MLSALCKRRNETIIPSLLSQHSAVLNGDRAVVDLSTADNWAVKEKVLPRLQAALGNLLEQDLAYASGIGGCTRTRTRLADLLNTHFRPSKTLDSGHIVLAAGGSFALTALVEQICEPGDGILIATPYWAGLDISISIHGRARIIPVDIPLDQTFQSESIRYFEDALSSTSVPVKAVLLCNPHNPLGQCYPLHTLKAMYDFCARRKLHYISDEVYALSAHHPLPANAIPFSSVLELNQTESGPLLHVIYSLSKDFGCNGIRLGALINQSNASLRLSAALSVHSQLSSLSTFFASEVILLPSVINEITKYGGGRLREAYAMVLTFVETNQMKYVPVHYGMFLFVRLLALDNEESESRLQLYFKLKGVSLSTGSSYHFKEPGWFRICYGMPLKDLAEGLDRINEGIQEYLANEPLEIKT